jgi:hypothetical protein
MLLYPRQYVRFLDGRMSDVAIVAFLPGHLAAQMPTLSTDVRIGREYAQKLWAKHGLGYGCFRLFQPAIDDGWCAKSRDNGLDFIYIDTSGAYIDARRTRSLYTGSEISARRSGDMGNHSASKHGTAGEAAFAQGG